MKHPSIPKKNKKPLASKPRPVQQKASHARRLIKKQKPAKKKITQSRAKITESFYGAKKPFFVKEFGDKSEYNNGYDRTAQSLHSEAFEKFVEADKEYFQRTGLNIDVNKSNARRSIRRQAELYTLKRWFGQGNPTDRPGHSLHNYGLAVDLIRTNENTLVEIMGNHGWTREKPHEPWHFEFTGSDAHGRAKNKINDLKKSNSPTTKWWNAMDNKFKKEKELESRTETYELQLSDYNAGFDEYDEWEKLYTIDVNEFNAWYKELEKDLVAHNQEVANHDKLVKQGNTWLAQIEAMEEGDAKDRELAEYDDWKAQMDRDFDILNGNADTIDADFAWAEGRALELDNEFTQLEERLVELTELGNSLNGEFDALKVLEEEIKNLEHKADALLNELEVLVQNI
ncbi:MAG: hypothetical protein ABJQ37_12765 [Reichenbachiella sp.]|uniref:M15 family metallopeptidase n=3 Tax=Reichenbachiella sp. TaxID=2184521 RepID=UPI00329A20A4